MTDKKPPAPTTPANQSTEPSIQVVTQFVKDLSFENPHAPESLVSGWPAPDTSVQVALNHAHVRDSFFECSMRVRVEAKNKKDNKMCFIIDLQYGALVALNNVAKEAQQAVLMVEVPKLLFPFAREIVAGVTSQGGYPPLYLAPINFEALYISEIKRVQAEKAAAGNKTA